MVEMRCVIRNTARFLLSNLFDFDQSNLVASNNLVLLDSYIIDSAHRLQQQIIVHYDLFLINANIFFLFYKNSLLSILKTHYVKLLKFYL